MSKQNRRENRKAVRSVMAKRTQTINNNTEIEILKKKIQDAKRQKNKRLEKRLERRLKLLTKG